MNIVYLIIQKSTSLKYIGSKKDYEKNTGYLGSPSCKESHPKYKIQQKWINDTKEKPEDFELKIIKEFKIYNQEVIDFEFEMQKKYNVVLSDEYINAGMSNKLMSYKGLNKNKVCVKDKEGKTSQVSTDDPRYLNGELKHINKSKIRVKDKEGKTSQVSTDDPRYLNGELVCWSKSKVTVKDKGGKTSHVSTDDPRYLNGELVHMSKKCTIVKDKDGNKFSVSVKDPRYLNGELVSIHKNRVTVKDINGRCFKVPIDDPRYLNGELIHVSRGLSNKGINKGIWNWRKQISINNIKKSVKEFANYYNVNCKDLQVFLDNNNIEYKTNDCKKSKKDIKKG